MDRQDKYEPIVVNLSKTEDIRSPRNYFVAFVASIVLLGVVGGFAAFYIRNRPIPPQETPTPQEPVAQASATEKPATPQPVAAQATPPKRPTAQPAAVQTKRPAAVSAPKSTPSQPPSLKPTTAAIVEKTPDAALTPIVNGYLTVKSAPPNADIRLDGKLLGKTPVEQYELTPGAYEVVFELDGQKLQETLRIVAGETTTYTHVFEGFGALIITTTSSNCDVSVNGKPVGKSPITVEGLSAGEYTLTISKEGYHTVEKVVTLTQGERQELFITVKRLGSRPAPVVNPEISPVPVHPSERQE